MNNDINCPDCGSEMDKGFLLDHNFTTIFQTYWHKDEPVTNKKGVVKADKKSIIPVISYKCTKCGLLKHYAV